MDASWERLGARVRQARFARQLDQPALAAKVGMERSGIVKIERGTRRVTAMELMALSDALSVPMTYFMTESPAAMVSQRTPLTGSASESEQARFEVDLALQQHLADVQQIKDLGLLPTSQVRIESDSAADPGTLAREVRRQLGFGMEPLPKMTDVAAACGLWLLVVGGAAEGASMSPDQGFGVSVLGAGADPGRRRFTAAHELGHHLLGDEYAAETDLSASRREREREIDAFAQEFLLPASVVRGALLGLSGDEARDALIGITAQYRVSWSMAARVFRESTERVSQWDRPLRADLIRVTGSTVQPDLDLGQTAAAWHQAVLAAQRDSWITAARAVEMLHGLLAVEDLPIPEEAPL